MTFKNISFALNNLSRNIHYIIHMSLFTFLLQSLQQQQQHAQPKTRVFVEGFLRNHYHTRCQNLSKNRNSMAGITKSLIKTTTTAFSAGPIATTTNPQQFLRNPNTNRNIRIGGKTHKELMNKGGYIIVKEELLPIKTQYLVNTSSSSTNNITIQKESMTMIDEEDPNRTLFHVLHPRVEPTAVEHDNDSDDITPYNQDSIQKYISKNYLFINKDAHVHTVPPRQNQNNTPSISSYFHNNNLTTASSTSTTKICHRLDRDTSGILILAHTPEAHSKMSQLFQNRQVKKSYVALVHGILQEEENRSNCSSSIDLPIGKEMTKEGYNRWVINGTNPRNALTHYKVLKQYNDLNYTKVLLHPQTGRGHQLRLHLKAIGHPILGDTLHYNSLHSVYAVPWRLCLHACRIEFTLDSKNCDIVVEAPTPF